MKKITIKVGPNDPNERTYQLSGDDQTKQETFIDALDSFRAMAFAHDLGIRTERQPKHDVTGQLRSLRGVRMLAFTTPNYTIFKGEGVTWEELEPKIIDILTKAFGGDEPVEVVR